MRDRRRKGEELLEVNLQVRLDSRAKAQLQRWVNRVRLESGVEDYTLSDALRDALKDVWGVGAEDGGEVLTIPSSSGRLLDFVADSQARSARLAEDLRRYLRGESGLSAPLQLK